MGDVIILVNIFAGGGETLPIPLLSNLIVTEDLATFSGNTPFHGMLTELFPRVTKA